MSYSKFTTKEVVKKFNLMTKRENFLNDVKLAPSELLMLNLESISTMVKPPM